MIKNLLPVGTVIAYKKNVWDEKDIPESGKATICGYDVFETKYHAIKHSWDNVPMENVKIWLFDNEIVSWQSQI